MSTIDSKKLLPAGKPGGSIVESQKPLLVPVNNVLFKKDVKISQKLLKPADKEKESGGSLVVIRKKITKISDIIQSTYLIEQSENNRKRREKERQKSEEREKQLETRKPTKVSEKNIAKISLPGRSILDTINRFLAFTLIGYLFDKYNQFLPKLVEFTKLITPVAQFIEAFGKNVVNRVIDFVDVGYQAYDKVRAEIKNIGGEGAQKTFDEFSKNLNTILNGAIGAAMLIASTSPKGVSGAGGAGASAAAKGGSRILERGTLSRLNASWSRYIAGNANIGDRARLLRRGFIGGRQALSSGGSKAVASGAARQIATQGAKQSARFAVTRAPLIGALIGFVIDTFVFREKPSRAAAGAVGNLVGSGIGAALAGAGTFGLGAGLGLIAGGFIGDLIGKSLYDAFMENKPEPIPAKAQGGQVSGGQSRVATSRRIKTTPRRTRRSYIPQKTQPGKDIGGKQKIEQLYGKDEPGKRSALRALKKSSEDLKKMKSLNGVAGAMFGAGIDMSLGQKPDKKLATSLGNTFGSVIQAAVDAELDSSFNDISRTIAMANGGVVPSREIKGGMSIGEKIGKYISNAFSIALESSAAKVLQNLNQEFNLEGGPPGGPPGGPGGGPGGGQIPGDAPPEVKAMLEAISTGEGGWDSVNPGTTVPGLSNMTIADARRAAIQKGINEKGGSGAMGKWQQMPDFILGRARSAGLDPDKDRFTPENQTKIARMLMSSVYPGGEAQLVKDARTDPVKAAQKLRGTWPSLPGGSQANTTEQEFRRNYQRSLQSYRSPQAVPGNVKDTGLKDSAGRSIKLKGIIADAFIDMAAAARKDGINLGSGISVALRDPEHNRRVGGAQGSRHLTGEAFDINWNSAAGRWIRNNASRFGFRYNPYSSQSTHFDWVGGYAPRSSPPPTQLGKVLSSTKVNGATYTVREGGKYYKNGKEITEAEYDKAFGLQLSLAPSQQTREIAPLQQTPSYSLVENNTILYQKEFVLT
jgi:hypothetical protein